MVAHRAFWVTTAAAGQVIATITMWCFWFGGPNEFRAAAGSKERGPR